MTNKEFLIYIIKRILLTVTISYFLIAGMYFGGMIINEIESNNNDIIEISYGNKMFSIKEEDFKSIEFSSMENKYFVSVNNGSSLFYFDDMNEAKLFYNTIKEKLK